MIPIISLINVSKTYKGNKTPSLNNINLDIIKGEKLGIFGPNGAGKTTLISLLCQITPLSQGSIKYIFEGLEKNKKEIQSSIGLVPQDIALYPELTAKQNLNYFGKIAGLNQDEVKTNSTELLTELDLDKVSNKKVSEFSGGMKRRLNLAIGLIHKPKIVFLDEPSVGVDIQSKINMFNLLNNLNQKGVTFIYTSHHLQEAENFCSRIVLLKQGEIVATDTLGALLKANNANSLENLILNNNSSKS